MRGLAITLFIFLLYQKSYSQACTTLGQTPSTAFPVCGTTTFVQTTVPICGNTNMIVPGCAGDGAAYQDKNPFWYKFTCFQTGTLAFTITPKDLGDDYDWQLFDITGHNPNDVYTDRNLFVIANWAGTYGLTGASAAGVSFVQCASIPGDGEPTFSAMPTLIQGHTYILMVSHYTDSQSGYSLSFGGGTAVITDPLLPLIVSAKPDCDGKKITLRLNKKVRCNTVSASGSEFTIPGGPAVISATPDSCSFAFDFQELVLTLATPVTNGNYNVVVNKGSDGNTLMDNCDHAIADNTQIPFVYNVPQPIFADSVGQVGCAPQEIKIYFPKKIDCSTIAANGSDFTVTGPTPVTVTSADGNCVNGKSDIITVKFSGPISTKGLYTVALKAGTDGTVVIDECGIEVPVHTRSFTCADTVSADFAYIASLNCKYNSLAFAHNGANDVNKWSWIFNTTVTSSASNYTIVWPASSTNTVQLAVTNGVCSDSTTRTIIMDNEVKANFEMPSILCPEDALTLTNTSTGLIDSWQWTYDGNNMSSLKEPQPHLFIYNNNIERSYTIKLKATNNTLNCADSISRKIRVLNNCFIAVPSAFTPNNDGLNDYLQPNNALKAATLEFRVFNRWGQLVFETKDWTKKWDGKIKGIPQAPDVYVWFLNYTLVGNGQKVFQKGTTTLIR
jgi:gliding motility-associated-like protein